MWIRLVSLHFVRCLVCFCARLHGTPHPPRSLTHKHAHASHVSFMRRHPVFTESLLLCLMLSYFRLQFYRLFSLILLFIPNHDPHSSHVPWWTTWPNTTRALSLNVRTIHWFFELVWTMTVFLLACREEGNTLVFTRSSFVTLLCWKCRLWHCVRYLQQMLWSVFTCLKQPTKRKMSLKHTFPDDVSVPLHLYVLIAPCDGVLVMVFSCSCCVFQYSSVFHVSSRL